MHQICDVGSDAGQGCRDGVNCTIEDVHHNRHPKDRTIGQWARAVREWGDRSTQNKLWDRPKAHYITQSTIRCQLVTTPHPFHWCKQDHQMDLCRGPSKCYPKTKVAFQTVIRFGLWPSDTKRDWNQPRARTKRSPFPFLDCRKSTAQWQTTALVSDKNKANRHFSLFYEWGHF